MKQKFSFSLISDLIVLFVCATNSVYAMNNNNNTITPNTTNAPANTTNANITNNNNTSDSQIKETAKVKETAKAPFLDLGVWDNVRDGARYLYSGCGNTAKNVGKRCKNGAQSFSRVH